MSGVDIVGALLRDYTPLTDMIPAAGIKGGTLPENTGLPAIVVRTASLMDRQPLTRAGWCRAVARIAVTVRAASYRDQGLLIKHIRSCCTGRTGDIGGGVRVSILSAGLGPDVAGPGNSFEQTQDFKVSFDTQN